MSKTGKLEVDQTQSAINTAKICAALLYQFDLPLALSEVERGSADEAYLHAARPLWAMGEQNAPQAKPDGDTGLGDEEEEMAKTRVVPASELDPAKSLRAEDYVKLQTEEDTRWTYLRSIVLRIHETAKAKGWWKKYDQLKEGNPALLSAFLPEIISSKLMLSVGEHGEALEEIRGSSPTSVYFSAIAGDRFFRGSHEEVQRFLDMAEDVESAPKPEGFGVEIADAIIRLFDLAAWLGIDIVSLIRMKMKYNEQRPYLHGGKKL